eukprot:s743_g3.t1
MSRTYTGEKGQPCASDYQTALETFKRNLKENIHWNGQEGLEGLWVRDDGKGWFWLVAGQNPGGLYLYVMKSPPYGERPLALIRESNVDEFFEKVNWHMLFVRLHKWNLWGGKAQDFPYPMMPCPRRRCDRKFVGKVGKFVGKAENSWARRKIRGQGGKFVGNAESLAQAHLDHTVQAAVA